MTETTKNITEKLKNFTGKKHTNLIFAIGLLGIALLLLSEFLPASKDKATEKTPDSSLGESAYTQKLQNELCDLLGQMEGVGRVQVMLTLESTTQSVYATAEKTQLSENGTQEQGYAQQSYQNDYVLVDGEDGKQALVEHTEMPQIRGVVVICDGGSNSSTICRVTEAVSVVLGITTNRICVTKMS